MDHYLGKKVKMSYDGKTYIGEAYPLSMCHASGWIALLPRGLKSHLQRNRVPRARQVKFVYLHDGRLGRWYGEYHGVIGNSDIVIS